MHRLIPLLLLLLSACGSATVTGFRDQSVPIYSIASVDPSRLAGQWTQAAAFAAPGAATCRGGGRIAPDLTADLVLCLNGRQERVNTRLQPSGPGRLDVGGQAWWIVWVDEGYRTLAIGTPSGAFGFILNRDGPLPEDRFRAAAEIFDFTGHDTRRLVRLP